jgi:hypothetical protein
VTRLAIVGAALVVGATFVLLLIGVRADAPTTSGRQLLLAALFTAPAAIGLAGGWRRSPPLLAAAGVLCLMQAVVAFSGVTVIYLPAGLAFVLAAAQDDEDARPGGSNAVTVALGVFAAILGGPVVVLLTGPYGLVLVVGLGALTWLALRRPSRGRTTGGEGFVLGFMVFTIVIGAWLAPAFSTRTVCWVERAGNREELPPGQEPTTEFGLDVTAGGCESGVPSLHGVTASIGLIAAAIGLAIAGPVRSVRASPGTRTRSRPRRTAHGPGR